LVSAGVAGADTSKAPPKVSPFEDPGQGPQTIPPPVQLAPGAAAATINVPADSATIQAAINGASSGDIILVAAGTYAEAILIDGKNLTITGAGAGSSIITGTALEMQYIVRITNGAVVDFSGFTVDGTGIDRQYGIYADAGSDGDIHDNEVKNVLWPGAGGIAIRRQECYIDVTNNDVYGFGRIGIYTRDDVIGNTDTGVISGNTVTALGGSDPDRLSYGISVYSGNPTIDNNDIYDCVSGANVSAWLSAGLDVWTGSTSAITNNNFYDSQYGIVSNSASPTISGNTFTNITADNVRLDYFVKGNPTPHWAEYYDTIQDAINAIPVTTYPCVVWIGIYSGGGTYAEALNINKACHIWGYSRAGVLLDVEGYAVNGAGAYITADNVLLSGFTMEGNNAVSTPRYGVKYGDYDGCYLDDAEIRNIYRTGVDILGATNLEVTNVHSHDNGGNGLQMCDANGVLLDGITTANNAWGGVAVFTYGRYTPIGASGIVFSGTNSFGETGADVGSIYLEEGNYSDPLNPWPITYSTNIGDGADVTVQLADVTHTLTGESDNDNNYTRFYATLGDAQTAAAGTVSHILGGRYIVELAGTNVYVPANLGGVGPAVAAAKSGDHVHVDPGTFDTSEQVVVDKDLTMSGAGSGATTITTSFDTGSSGDARAWFLVDTGYDFDLSGVTLDGTGQLVYQAIRNKGLGSCDDVVFTEIKYNESGPTYSGVAIAAFGTGPVDVTNSAFSEIGRIGVLYFGSVVNVSTFSGNTYTGKGVGDWLDYALDISAGAHVTVTGNYISGCRGVASSDGSTSGAVMVTTYYGAGTAATILDNTLTDNSTGILVGYDLADASTVEAHNNLIYGNDTGVSSKAAVVDATDNWWGDATGPYHATLNPGGLGNPVSDYVLFDPYMVGPSVVSIDPAYDITNCGTPLTYAVRLDHGGVPPEVRGFDVTLTVPTTYATVVTPTFGGDFTEGSVLNPIGGTYFAAVDNGGGVYTISGAILGGTTGSTLSGDLFYVTLTPTGAEGTGAIGLSGLLLRDPDNVPLPGGVVGGDVQVDCTVPTMEAIVELENECYNVAPTFANFGFDDDVNLDSAEFKIDGSAWTTIFSGLSNPEWNDDGWALPGFAGLGEGTHTVYFRVTDMAGNVNGEGTPDTYSWAFIKDTVAPDFPTDFVAMPGNQKVHLSWTNPTGDASFMGVEIRRVGWRDYPQYTGGGPSYPANATEGAPVVQTSGNSYDDPLLPPATPRDIYYYAAFAYDCAGNYSVYDVAASDRATNYWLGDIDSTGTVEILDLVTFSGTYGTIEGGAGFVPEADFGPTDDWSRYGIPLPDDAVQFEDLMIFAMNYGNVTAAGAPPLARTDGRTLRELVTFGISQSESRSGDGAVTLAVNVDNNAEALKGLRLTVEFGVGNELVAVEKGGLVSGKGMTFFGTIPAGPGRVYIDVAALGTGVALDGSGEVARLTVRPGGSEAVEVRLVGMDLRDVNNERDVIEVAGGGNHYLPTVSALGQNHPNPFNPNTTISYDVAAPGLVSLRIYDVSGRLVRTLVDEWKGVGRFDQLWDGTDNNGVHVTSGVYFYRMTSPGFKSQTRKMLLLK
jgi:hypothetical protein